MFSINALIVDDHRLFAEAIMPSLEQLGMDVTLATTGQEALDVVATSKIDLALVDLGLPDMKGIDVGAQIVDMQPEATVLALTAIDDQRFVAPVLQAGFSGYLTKGLRITGLVSAITAALEGQLVTPGLSTGSSGASRTRTQQHVELLASTLTPRAPRPRRKGPGDRTRDVDQRPYRANPRAEHPRQAAGALPTRGGDVRRAARPRSELA